MHISPKQLSVASLMAAALLVLSACDDSGDSNSTAQSSATAPAVVSKAVSQSSSNSSSGSTTSSNSTKAVVIPTTSNSTKAAVIPTTSNSTTAVVIPTTSANGSSSNNGTSNDDAPMATLSGDTSRPSNSTFVLGETVLVSFKASGLPVSKSTPLSIKVSDEFGNEVSSTTLTMSADASGAATAIFTSPASSFGYYRIDAALPDGATMQSLGTRPAGFVTYAVVPDPANRTNYGDAGSRFGMQGGFSYAQGSVMSYLGIRYLMDEPGWMSLEPDHAGQFAEARSQALAKGQEYPPHIANNSAQWPTFAIPLLTTASIPTWSMVPGTGTKLSPNMGVLNSSGMQGFPEFASARASGIATDFSAQSAHYYQVTWEPEMPVLFGGTPTQLVQYYQVSYQAIHQADSKALVMGPTMFPGDEAAMQELWAAGLANYIDAVSMHPYVQFPPETNGLVSNIRTQIQMAQTAKGHSIDFVGTEHGFTSASIGELNEALGNVRTTIILLGEGFKFDVAFYIADFWSQSASETSNTYGYYWNLNPKIAFGTDKIGPKPAAPAFSAMTYFLDGTTTAGPVSNLTGTQMGYRFHRGVTTILALWDYQAKASSATLPFPSQSVQVCDWMGNCSTRAQSGAVQLSLGSSPTYVIGTGL